MNKFVKFFVIPLSLSFALSGIVLAKEDAKKPAAPATAAPASSAASSTTANSKAEKVELLDLNSATKKELSELPKIGDARSNAIINGRPYKGKDELLSKKIIPQDAYNSIKDLVIARQKPAK